MNVLTYGEIMDGGTSVFHAIAKADGDAIVLTFEGAIRIDNPYRHLSVFLDALKELLPKQAGLRATIDFVDLKFCNSNGFYIIMDIVEIVYAAVAGPIVVRRIKDDDWQQETLPILLNIDEEIVAKRTSFENVREL
jgi:hypothetical protein